MDMKSKKLKTLVVALALTMTIGAVPPATGTEIPMLTTTVEAAAKKVYLKAYNKKVYAGRAVYKKRRVSIPDTQSSLTLNLIP